MAISEQWLPIISEVISWIRENIGPSKKELKLQVSDLKKQVQTLAAGNAKLIDNLEMIVREILKNLKADNNYTISADTIVFVGSSIDVAIPSSPKSLIPDDRMPVERFEISKIFDGVDEEIAHSRITKPSDRR